MNYILISDTKYRKAYDITNIINHEFPEIPILLGVDSISLSKKINYRLSYGNKKIVLLRSYDEELFERDLDNLSMEYSNDSIIYIPVEEGTTDFFCTYVKKNKNGVFKFLLPDSNLYRMFRNKADLNEYCLENGIAAPKRYNISDLSDDVYPIILKPKIGSGSIGIIRLDKKEDYTEEIKKNITESEYLAQELIPNGKNVQGAFYLCKDGEILGAYTHKRIRTMPEEGGVTVCSQIGDNKVLIDEGSRLLKVAKWNGLIMLEFLYDSKSDKYKIIEANPRLWGSIMLSEFSGANLLKNYVNICLGNPIEPADIKENTKIRWPLIDFICYVKKLGRISLFWNTKDTCFINWTYAEKLRALIFLITSVLNLTNLKKLFNKI